MGNRFRIEASARPARARDERKESGSDEEGGRGDAPNKHGERMEDREIEARVRDDPESIEEGRGRFADARGGGAVRVGGVGAAGWGQGEAWADEVKEKGRERQD